MTKSTRRLAVATLAASGLAGAGSAQAAPTPVETLQASTPIAAYGGTAMWSRLDLATGKFQLVQSVDGGAPTVVGVPERDGAFDVDLGSNRSGSTYAVYTRDGDLIRLNPRTAREEELTTLSSPELVEHDPSIQRGRIAFLRTDGGYEQLRVGDTTRGAKGTTFVVKSKALQSAELGIAQVAYIDRAGNKQRVHVRNLSTGHDQIVYQAGSGGASFTVVTRPSFAADSKSFVWARSIIGTAGSRIVKYTLRTSALSYAQGSPRYAAVGWVDDARGAIASTSIDAGLRGGNCSDAGVEYCSVLQTGPLSFDLRP